MRLTQHQEGIMFELLHGCYIGISKNKRGEYSHYLIFPYGRKQRIKSSTFKVIQRYLKSKIKST